MKNCLNCGQPVYKSDRTGTRSSTKKYCSNSCQMAYQGKQFIAGWLSGELSGGQSKHPELTNNYVRNYMLQQADHKCSKCGWGEENPFSNSIPLEVDHINGNSLDHSFSNLRVLCPNCHSLTEFNGILNKGRGRKIYREAYRKE